MNNTNIKIQRGSIYNYRWKDIEQRDRTKQVAVKLDCSMKEIISNALDYYLQQFSKGNIKWLVKHLKINNKNMSIIYLAIYQYMAGKLKEESLQTRLFRLMVLLQLDILILINIMELIWIWVNKNLIQMKLMLIFYL